MTFINKAHERRWKQSIRSQEHDFFAIIAPGFISQAQIEFLSLGIPSQIVSGGLHFSGKLEVIWKIHALARIPTRILLRIRKFRALRFEKLRELSKKIPWDLYLPSNCSVDVHVSTQGSRLWHQEAISETFMQSIKSVLREFYGETPCSSEADFKQKIYLRIVDDDVQISLDCSGEALYLRGNGKWIDQAPIRDTLAAALWSSVGIGVWDHIVDPFCGSGTFALEYLQYIRLLECKRDFAFMHWHGFSFAAWNHLLQTWQKERLQLTIPNITLRDRSDKAIQTARHNLKEIGFGKQVHFENCDFLKSKAPELINQSGILISNLPYGERSKIPQDGIYFFKQLGETLRKEWQGWHYALVIPEGMAEKALRLKVERRIPFDNGGIPVVCLLGQI